MRTLVIEVDDLDGGSYPVRLLVEDGRESWLDEPLARARIPAVLPALPAALGAGDEPPAPEAIRERFLAAGSSGAVFEQIGEYLARLVIRDDVRRVVEEQAALHPGESQAGQEGLRLLFRVTPVELRRLPWELLRWRAGPLPAFADERNPCARLHALEPAAEEPDKCWPVLRVLVVVGALDDDVETDEEITCLRRALVRHTGFIDVEVCHRPARQKLAELCRERRPHILHFIGHGTGGALEFAPDRDQPGWSWGTTQIAMDLQGWVPRVVVLNACRSAEIGHQSGAWDLVDGLFALGVPAIVGMQGDIDGAAAAAFGGALYGALIRGANIDVAVAMARKEMSYVVPFDSRDVWLPTLTLSAPPERVLPAQYGVSYAECQTIVDSFKERHECEIYAIVARAQPRRTLLRRVGVALEEERKGGAMAIVGASMIGKSALAKWCVGTVALRGGNAAYVPLGGGRTLGVAELLGSIAEALVDSDRHGDANAEAFDEYVEQVDRLLGLPAPTNGDRWRARRYQRTIEAGSESLVDDVFQAFRVALERAAGDHELVIALDDPSVIEQSYWDRYVAPLLIKPIAERHLPVRLILVAERPVYERLLDARLRARVPAIELDKLEPQQFVPLANEHLAACGYDTDDLESFVANLGDGLQRHGRRWDGQAFQLLHQYARTYGAEPVSWTSTQ